MISMCHRAKEEPQVVLVLQRLKVMNCVWVLTSVSSLVRKSSTWDTLSDHGISARSQERRSLEELPEILNNVKQVRGFLGLVGYYRQPIKDSNEKAKPLHDLKKENWCGNLNILKQPLN